MDRGSKIFNDDYDHSIQIQSIQLEMLVWPQTGSSVANWVHSCLIISILLTNMNIVSTFLFCFEF